MAIEGWKNKFWNAKKRRKQIKIRSDICRPQGCSVIVKHSVAVTLADEK
jgi:hypothetical protein